MRACRDTKCLSANKHTDQSITAPHPPHTERKTTVKYRTLDPDMRNGTCCSKQRGALARRSKASSRSGVLPAASGARRNIAVITARQAGVAILCRALRKSTPLRLQRGCRCGGSPPRPRRASGLRWSSSTPSRLRIAPSSQSVQDADAACDSFFIHAQRR